MFSSQNIQGTLQRLAAQRPIFHSEADFQHALAWSVHQADPNAAIRIEVPFRADGYSEYLDLLVVSRGQSFAVELKYKTRKIVHRHDAEEFSLRMQSAHDIGRYDFLADVGRLERFVAAGRAKEGCAILVTNDSNYWSPTTRQGTADQMFRLDEGRVLNGPLAWGSRASAGTKRGRERAVTLNGRYVATWKPYSAPCMALGGEFRFLAWHVK